MQTRYSYCVAQFHCKDLNIQNSSMLPTVRMQDVHDAIKAGAYQILHTLPRLSEREVRELNDPVQKLTAQLARRDHVKHQVEIILRYEANIYSDVKVIEACAYLSIDTRQWHHFPLLPQLEFKSQKIRYGVIRKNPSDRIEALIESENLEWVVVSASSQLEANNMLQDLALATHQEHITVEYIIDKKQDENKKYFMTAYYDGPDRYGFNSKIPFFETPRPFLPRHHANQPPQYPLLDDESREKEPCDDVLRRRAEKSRLATMGIYGTSPLISELEKKLQAGESSQFIVDFLCKNIHRLSQAKTISSVVHVLNKYQKSFYTLSTEDGYSARILLDHRSIYVKQFTNMQIAKLVFQYRNDKNFQDAFIQGDLARRVYDVIDNLCHLKAENPHNQVMLQRIQECEVLRDLRDKHARLSYRT